MNPNPNWSQNLFLLDPTAKTPKKRIKEKKSYDFVHTLLKRALKSSEVEETSEDIHTVVFDGF